MTVRSVSMRDGIIWLEDIQVPEAVYQSVKRAQEKFSWKKFNDMAVAGNNPYAQRYQVLCRIDTKTFAGQTDIKEGIKLSVNAKLESFRVKQIVFKCKF